ncbi:LpxL/LpxP family acyltransferase [Noviherbaspirillum pedocola]|uniref:Acyl-CoA synthetase n=1 Tax=Noviherbaspirillum pedocola TaxID=2801341 RepID=A0A934SWH6_9BURK|nr:acyl-CoA synthetase [Noviherbaspirillum pedocola]MBK4736698.1 acyl-CoA synthetase [Noviherbaspirillum pedocola]
MQTSKPADAAWQHRPERSNMTMLRIMTWISLRLGRSAGRIVLHGIAAYFLAFAPASRAASRAYLTRALGRAPRTVDIYRHIFVFAATIHDRVYLLNNRFDLFDIEVEGDALMRGTLAPGGGLFLIGAHLGSFEVMRALGREKAGAPVAMAMYEENAKKLNSMLAAINPQAGQEVIGLGHIDSMLKISAALDRGAMVGVLADRGLGGDAYASLPFLGAEAPFPRGPFRMAALMRRPVVFMTGLYLGGNRYRIRFEQLADFTDMARGQREAAIDAAMARYAALLDAHCRAYPYNWFNFFDFWRPAGAAKDSA